MRIKKLDQAAVIGLTKEVKIPEGGTLVTVWIGPDGQHDIAGSGTTQGILAASYILQKHVFERGRDDGKEEEVLPRQQT